LVGADIDDGTDTALIEKARDADFPNMSRDGAVDITSQLSCLLADLFEYRFLQFAQQEYFALFFFAACLKTAVPRECIARSDGRCHEGVSKASKSRKMRSQQSALPAKK
jgi:hypothetical protein